jgi:hypothetical protein
MQHAATQHTHSSHIPALQDRPFWRYFSATHRNTLQHTAIHCNTLQYTAIHSNTRIWHTYLHCKIDHFGGISVQHTTTHRNTLQYTATHCNTQQHTHLAHTPALQDRPFWRYFVQHTETHCNTLQHTATHCNTLQHTHFAHIPALQDQPFWRYFGATRPLLFWPWRRKDPCHWQNSWKVSAFVISYVVHWVWADFWEFFERHVLCCFDHWEGRIYITDKISQKSVLLWFRVLLWVPS